MKLDKPASSIVSIKAKISISNLCRHNYIYSSYSIMMNSSLLDSMSRYRFSLARNTAARPTLVKFLDK